MLMSTYLVNTLQEIAFAPGKSPEEVYCDSEGWTVIQSRGQFHNSIYYFLRDWEAYENGFGQAGEKLHCIEYPCIFKYAQTTLL
jgi:hypothetical protein